MPVPKKVKPIEEFRLDGPKYDKHLEIVLSDGLECHSRIMMLLKHFKDSAKQNQVKNDFGEMLDRLQLKTANARSMIADTTEYMKLNGGLPATRDIKQNMVI